MSLLSRTAAAAILLAAACANRSDSGSATVTFGELTGTIADSATVTVIGRNIDGGTGMFTLIGGANALQVALNVTITNDDDTTAAANAVLFKM